MKRIILTIAVLGGLATFTATDANAFVCARGLHRAGCVAPRGRVAVRRVAGPVGYHGALVRRGGFRRY